jgi:hypothetical protein
VKIELERQHVGRREGLHSRPVARSAPFWHCRSVNSTKTHRVRSAVLHVEPMIPHITAKVWCGAFFFTGNGDFTHTPPSDRPVCVKCERIALMAGQPSSDDLLEGTDVVELLHRANDILAIRAVVAELELSPFELFPSLLEVAS